MANVMILNGAGKRNGRTSSLVRALSEGVGESGGEVREFNLQKMDIRGCLDCQGCARKEPGYPAPCVQKDDMQEIYDAFKWADVMVLASPMYWWSVTGTLRTAVDRLYALFRSGYSRAGSLRTALVMTAGGNDYSIPLAWYANFEKWMGWKDAGVVLGAGKEDEARVLGASL